MYRRFLTLLLAGSLALSQLAPGAHAQGQPAGGAQTGGQTQTQPPTPAATPQPFPLLDKKSEKIKRAVSRIGIGERLTVIIKNGDDLHGTVTQVGADAFLLAEVDRHEVLTVLYRDVEKVRSGYGGVSLFTGRRASPPRGAKIATFVGVLFVAIGLPLILVATAKD